MTETFRAFVDMTRQNPMVVLGFALLGTFLVLFIHVWLKMWSVGYKPYPMFSHPSDWGLPAKYLKIRSQHGWSPWPVYLLWPCLFLGIGSLILALFLLQN